MQEKTAVLESTKGVERDRQYMRNVYNTLSRITAKSWKYTLPRCEEPSSHTKGLIEAAPLYTGPSALPRGFFALITNKERDLHTANPALTSE